MHLLRLVQTPVHRLSEPTMRLPRRDLLSLRRWMEHSAAAALTGGRSSDREDHLVSSAAERRDGARQSREMAAELRPISACGIGLIQPATVRDVSSDGIALWTAGPVERGQQLSIEIFPPAELPRRRFRRAERPVGLLGVVRYCRAEGNGHVVGCSIGVSWVDSLANQMFPADLALRRTA